MDEGMTFEGAVEQLEAIVTAMETGSLPLEQCLRQFEQAVSLSRYCAEQLEAAEQQIAVLSSEGRLETVQELSWEERDGDLRAAVDDPFAP